MNFTDLFIRKPVVATVVSLLILVLGLRSIFNLPVNQYPRTEHAVVTVATAYYGADAATVGGFITQPLESSIAQAQGIDYLSSTSVNSVSTITATLRLNYSANKALTEITTQVNAVKNQLPPQAQQPVITVQMSDNTDAMYMGFYSEVLPTNNITDYLVRVVKPQLDSIPGVQTAEILGARNFALRAWLDPQRMAAHGVTATDVNTALAGQQLPVGPGHHQGPDGQRGPHRRHGPAHRGGVQATGHPPERGRHRAPGGRGHRDPGRRRLFLQRVLQRPAVGLHRHQGGPRGQYPRRGQAGARRLPGDPVPAPHGPHRRDRLRRHELHQHLHHGSDQDPGGGPAHRHGGDLPLPGHLAGRGRAGDRHAAFPGGHLRRDAGPGLLHQPAHAAGPGAGHRPGGGRRHHRGGERRPAHAGGQDAPRGGPPGGPGTGRAHPGHDGGAGGGLRAHRLPGRASRAACSRSSPSPWPGPWRSRPWWP